MMSEKGSGPNRLFRLVRRTARSQIAQSTLVNYFGVLVTAVGSVLVARALGPEGRGQFAALMAWLSLALVAGELGQSGAVTHWVARCRKSARDLVTSGRLITVIGSVLVGSMAAAFASSLADGDPTLTLAYWVAFATCLINGFWAPYVYAAQGISIRVWNFIRVLQPLLYVAMIIAFFMIDVLSIVALATALVISTTVQLVAARVVARRLGIGKGRLGRKELRSLIRYGSAHYMSQVPATISTQYDKALLSQTVTDGVLGQYAVAGTVAALGGPLSSAFASVTFPRFSASTTSKKERTQSENRLIRLTGGLTLVVVLLICAAAVFLVPLIFGADFAPAITLVWLLAPAMWIRALSEIVLVLIRSRGKPGLVAWARAAGLLAGVTTILPLVGWLGVGGAAVSLLALEIVTLSISVLLLRNLRKAEERKP